MYAEDMETSDNTSTSRTGVGRPDTVATWIFDGSVTDARNHIAGHESSIVFALEVVDELAAIYSNNGVYPRIVCHKLALEKVTLMMDHP